MSLKVKVKIHGIEKKYILKKSDTSPNYSEVNHMDLKEQIFESIEIINEEIIDEDNKYESFLLNVLYIIDKWQGIVYSGGHALFRSLAIDEMMIDLKNLKTNTKNKDKQILKHYDEIHKNYKLYKSNKLTESRFFMDSIKYLNKEIDNIKEETN